MRAANQSFGKKEVSLFHFTESSFIVIDTNVSLSIYTIKVNQIIKQKHIAILDKIRFKTRASLSCTDILCQLISTTAGLLRSL